MSTVLVENFLVDEVMKVFCYFSRDKSPAFNAIASDPNSSWVPAPSMEGENDTMSNAQRSTLKWEKEEALGEMATVAPVLYTNINFPNLKEEFPGQSWMYYDI